MTIKECGSCSVHFRRGFVSNPSLEADFKHVGSSQACISFFGSRQGCFKASNGASQIQFSVQHQQWPWCDQRQALRCVCMRQQPRCYPVPHLLHHCSVARGLSQILRGHIEHAGCVSTAQALRSGMPPIVFHCPSEGLHANHGCCTSHTFVCCGPQPRVHASQAHAGHAYTFEVHLCLLLHVVEQSHEVVDGVEEERSGICRAPRSQQRFVVGVRRTRTMMTRVHRHRHVSTRGVLRGVAGQLSAISTRRMEEHHTRTRARLSIASSVVQRFHEHRRRPCLAVPVAFVRAQLHIFHVHAKFACQRTPALGFVRIRGVSRRPRAHGLLQLLLSPAAERRSKRRSQAFSFRRGHRTCRHSGSSCSSHTSGRCCAHEPSTNDRVQRHVACLQPGCPLARSVAGRRGPGGGRMKGNESQDIVHCGLLQASGHRLHVCGSSDAVHGGHRSLSHQAVSDGSFAQRCDRPRYQ
mmetsp:Transcript_4015/g.14207  ORF Transcript_4015/g.14207 Transcript_4015/m.14207 type:complete len:466 (-) Transcript_4015:315-1712(-)